jgi:hypothetical protein
MRVDSLGVLNASHAAAHTDAPPGSAAIIRQLFFDGLRSACARLDATRARHAHRPRREAAPPAALPVGHGTDRAA